MRLIRIRIALYLSAQAFIWAVYWSLEIRKHFARRP